MSRPPVSASAPRWLAPVLLALGIAAATVLWVLAALALGRQCGWIALPVALELALILRWSGLCAGPARAALAAAGTLATSAAAQWGIAAAHIGGAMGLDPWTSALKMGPAYAATLSALANTGFDLLCLAAAPVLAAAAGLFPARPQLKV